MSCEKGWLNKVIYPPGCTDESACNYNPDASKDDSSCLFLDCADECGGQAVEDVCGVCDDNPSNDGSYDNCDVCDNNDENNCEEDCAGNWGGTSYEDDCGICDDNPSNDGYYDDCGICDDNPSNDGYYDDCDICDDNAENDCNVFIKFYDGNYIFSVIQDSDEGFIFTGSNDDLPWVVKTNLHGDIEWIKNYVSGNRGHTIIKSNDDALIVLTDIGGCSLIKLDNSGNEIWNQTYDDCEIGGSDEQVKQTLDGGYIIIGNYDDSAVLIKTDSNGIEEWRKIDYYNMSNFKAVIQTSDGGYLYTGTGYPSGSSYLIAIKTDSFGNFEWWTTTGSGDNGGNSVIETIDGGYLIVGQGNFSAYLKKIDYDGNEVWTQSYEGDTYAKILSVKQTHDGNYIAVGKNSGGNGYSAVWLLKVDSQGNKIWEKFLNNNHTFGQTIEITSDNGLIISGWSSTANTNWQAHSFLIKTDSEGNTVPFPE